MFGVQGNCELPVRKRTDQIHFHNMQFRNKNDSLSFSGDAVKLRPLSFGCTPRGSRDSPRSSSAPKMRGRSGGPSSARARRATGTSERTTRLQRRSDCNAGLPRSSEIYTRIKRLPYYRKTFAIAKRIFGIERASAHAFGPENAVTTRS